MAYYKAGTRKGRRAHGADRKIMSDEDVRQARNFAALKPKVWVKVIETATPRGRS